MPLVSENLDKTRVLKDYLSIDRVKLKTDSKKGVGLHRFMVSWRKEIHFHWRSALGLRKITKPKIERPKKQLEKETFTNVRKDVCT